MRTSRDRPGTEATPQPTQTGQIFGTPHDMSPEQAPGRPVDHRSDLVSLGIVLYELLTGRRPFSGADMGETLQRIINAQPEAIARFNYDVPPEVERILRNPRPPRGLPMVRPRSISSANRATKRPSSRWRIIGSPKGWTSVCPRSTARTRTPNRCTARTC